MQVSGEDARHNCDISQSASNPFSNRIMFALNRGKRHIGVMAKVAPSILAADFSRLQEEVLSADQTGVDIYHLDIMDGHFVPNISFGPAVVQTIDRLTERFLDVHLMLSEPEKYFEAFASAGADNITFHLEVHPELDSHVTRLHELGVKAGISFNPDMPVEKVLPHIEKFDFLLVMSVFPGFGGQEFIQSSLPSIETARKFIDAHGLSTVIEVDGGVNRENARRIIEAGADVLVMGTAFFKADDRAALVREISAISREEEKTKQ